MGTKVPTCIQQDAPTERNDPMAKKKIRDITKKKELDPKDLKKVGGGMLLRRPETKMMVTASGCSCSTECTHYNQTTESAKAGLSGEP